MPHIRVSDLVKYAAAAVGGGYIFGSDGQKCSLALRQSCATANPSQATNILGKGAKWDGHYVWDCSGLFRGAWRALWNYRSGGATTIYNTWCAIKGTIDAMPDRPGVLVFRCNEKNEATKEHIGLYIGGGEVVDARSTDQGVRRQPLSAYAWTHWALADDVDYDNTLPEVAEIPALWTGTVKTRTGNGISLWRDDKKTPPALAKVPEGATVDVLGDAGPGGFSECRYGGKTGLCDLRYVIPADGEDPGQETQIAELVGVSMGLNLRTSPETGHNTILLIPPHARVEVFPEMEKGKFSYVRYLGETGYATSSYLRKVSVESEVWG